LLKTDGIDPTPAVAAELDVFDLSKLPFICHTRTARPLVFRKNRVQWNEVVTDFSARFPGAVQPILRTFPSAGDGSGDVGDVTITNEFLDFAQSGFYNIISNFGAFKILILPGQATGEDIICISRFCSANIVHSAYDASVCSQPGYYSRVLYYPNVINKLFFSDQPLGFFCGQASLGLCGLFATVGYPARQLHLHGTGIAHLAAEVFDGERWVF